MKKRYVYSLLFGIPGLLLAGLVSIVLFGSLMGFLWLFVFGDDPWPSYIEQIVPVLFVLSVLVVWFVFIVTGYVIGRSLEKDPVLNRNHFLISAAVTLLFILLIAVRQWSVENIGSAADSVQCSDFCTLHGFSGSSLPPGSSADRICSCFDSSGNEAMRIPLDHLDPDFPR
ncbi:MAG TPA: hypothetical protein VJ785_15935 [Anaerolineales bacterium]|nr:hypothetical protein [Anaerolineales bacterium]